MHNASDRRVKIVKILISIASFIYQLLLYIIITNYIFYRNIIVDIPSDQTSRWSSDIDNHPQV